MSKEIKLIALDLDGTLVKYGEDLISKENLMAIKSAQDAGVEVVIATGRSRTTSLKLGQQLGVRYMINVNGGEIWTTEGELLHRHPLDRETVKQIIKIQSQYSVYSWFVSADQIIGNELPADYLDKEWLKFGFDVEDDHVRDEMIRLFSQMDSVELSNSSLTNMELNPKGVHKASAIEYLLDKLALSFDQVMAVGDSINDLKMIEAAGIGVAMGNAQDTVKEVADWETVSYDVNGVAVAIEKFVLGSN